MNRRLAATAALCAMAALIFSAKEAAAACLNALELCGRMIIPALFPFFVLSILLNRLGLPGILGKVFAPFASRLYGISGAGASALLIGLLPARRGIHRGHGKAGLHNGKRGRAAPRLLQ